MKNLLLSVSLLLQVVYVSAQNEQLRLHNTISLNSLGNASIFSLNYERNVFLKPNHFVSGKIGIGFNSELCFFNCKKSPDNSSMTIPMHLTYNSGGNNLLVEFGFGSTYYTVLPAFIIYPIFGIRVYPLKSKRINFRLFFQKPLNSLVSRNKNTEIILHNYPISPIGLSFGVSF